MLIVIYGLLFLAGVDHTLPGLPPELEDFDRVSFACRNPVHGALDHGGRADRGS